MINKLKLLIRFVFALVLIPLVIGVSRSFYRQLGAIKGLSEAQSLFLLGVGSYLLIHAIFYKPIYLYVLGHELTHALSSLLCGGKIKSIHVSSQGGRVSTTKTNLITILSPYFIPIYTIMVFLIYFGLSLFTDIQKYSSLFIFLVGFTLAFHIVLTIDFLKKNQPDILKSGRLFSLFLIYIVNVSVVVFVLGFVFPEVTFPSFFKTTSLFSKEIYLSLFNQLF
jgi:hypothetical protein